MSGFTLSIVRVGCDAVIALGYSSEEIAQKAVDEMTRIMRKKQQITIEIKQKNEVSAS